MHPDTTIQDIYFKKLSFINVQLLRTDVNIFNKNLNQYLLSIRQKHLFRSKEIIKSKLNLYDMPVKKTFYETKLSAINNIRLTIVRKQSDTTVYCKGYDKTGKYNTVFDGYYFKSELTKILNP